jgi:ABC-type sugar transport system ATPase subunit
MNPPAIPAHGIETVYQDLALFGDLSIYYNMFLGRERHKRVPGVKLLLQSFPPTDASVKDLRKAGFQARTFQGFQLSPPLTGRWEKV